MGDETIVRIFAAIDSLQKQLYEMTHAEIERFAEMKEDQNNHFSSVHRDLALQKKEIEEIEKAMAGFQQIAAEQELEIKSHNEALIRINERIKTALWVMAGVYTISQVLGLWDRIRLLVWG